jgi:hypothetical protein
MRKRLSLLLRTFTPVEERLLEEIYKALPEHIRGVYLEQTQSINKVQRYLDWTEINFYHFRKGKSDWGSVQQFRRTDEFTLASVGYRMRGIDFKTTLQGVSGHIFSLVTRPSIKKYSFEKIETIHYVRIHDDPTFFSSKEIPTRDKLPPAYLEYIAKEGIYSIGGWNILEIKEVYQISLSTDDFLIFAERQGEEYLMTRDNLWDQGIYYTSVGEGKIYKEEGPLTEIMLNGPQKNRELTEKSS